MNVVTSRVIRMDHRSTIWFTPFALLSKLLLGIVVVSIAWFSWTEWSAASQLRQAKQRALNTGAPIDDATMTKWFEQKTSKDKTNAWSEILALSASNEVFGDVILWSESDDESQAQTDEKSTSPEAHFRKVAMAVEAFRPLLDRIHRESYVDRPVWLPIYFEGPLTLLQGLQNSRGVRRLLLMEFEYAWYTHDIEQALKSMQALHRCLTVFDWPLGSIATTFHTGQRTEIYTHLEETLLDQRWSEAHLVDLQTLLLPMDLAKTWQDMVDADQALITRDHFFYETRSSPEERILYQIISRPSMRKELSDENWKAREVGRVGYERFAEAIYGLQSDQISTRDGRDRWLTAVGVGAQESHRRFTLAAIEIRLFQAKHGRLPKNLGELSSIQASHSVHRSRSGKPFEYRIMDDGRKAMLVSEFVDEQIEAMRKNRADYFQETMIRQRPELHLEMEFESSPHE